MQSSKTTIADTDPDFGDWEIRLDGTPLGNVLAADAEQGVALVRCGQCGRMGGSHLVHGRVTILPRPTASAGRPQPSLP